MKALHGNESQIAALHENGCRGKIRHPSKAHAMSAGRRTLADSPQRARRKIILNAYRCRACGKWHIGNSPRHLLHDKSAMIRVDATPLERALAAVLKPYLDAERSVS